MRRNTAHRSYCCHPMRLATGHSYSRKLSNTDWPRNKVKLCRFRQTRGAVCNVFLNRYTSSVSSSIQTSCAATDRVTCYIMRKFFKVKRSRSQAVVGIELGPCSPMLTRPDLTFRTEYTATDLLTHHRRTFKDIRRTSVRYPQSPSPVAS